MGDKQSSTIAGQLEQFLHVVMSACNSIVHCFMDYNATVLVWAESNEQNGATSGLKIARLYHPIKTAFSWAFSPH